MKFICDCDSTMLNTSSLTILGIKLLARFQHEPLKSKVYRPGTVDSLWHASGQRWLQDLKLPRDSRRPWAFGKASTLQITRWTEKIQSPAIKSMKNRLQTVKQDSWGICKTLPSITKCLAFTCCCVTLKMSNSLILGLALLIDLPIWCQYGISRIHI